MVQTVWSSTAQFLKEYNDLDKPDAEKRENSASCFSALFDHLSALQKKE